MNANPTTQHTIASGQRPIDGWLPGRPHRRRARIAGEVAQARDAPITPVTPQAAICQGVHGPWPKKKFDVSPASAPTAKPGPPPSA